MHIPLRLPFVLAIAESYFGSGPLADPHYDHPGSAIMHDSDYAHCANPSGIYHQPPPGALVEM